jgi:diadenosine tetraphosphate (Ap4A) HIT family hydrolase/GNAT superfamily N-acetyltransferase
MSGWSDRDAWERLRRGEGCPLCETVRAGFDEDDYGVTLARTESSLIRLARNQRARGYCVVVATLHKVEPFELGPGERQAFFDEVLSTGQAIQEICRPIKINYELLGNSVPHLHAHVVPRYADDGAPGGPLPLFTMPPLALPDADFAELAATLRAELVKYVSTDQDELRFEPLGMNDLPYLQELCESCADYYHLMTGGPVPRSEADVLYTLRPETASLDDKFLVAVKRGRRLIGVLDLYRHYPRRQLAWLGLLLLHPDLRGYGYGTAMISWMLQWAKEQGCSRIRVGIADDNLRALEVLRRHSFVPTGEKISRVSGSRRLVLLPFERML